MTEMNDKEEKKACVHGTYSSARQPPETLGSSSKSGTQLSQSLEYEGAGQTRVKSADVSAGNLVRPISQSNRTRQDDDLSRGAIPKDTRTQSLGLFKPNVFVKPGNNREDTQCISFQLDIKFSTKLDPGKIKSETKIFSCSIDKYMKWKYVLNSPVKLQECNKNAYPSVKLEFRSDSTLIIKQTMDSSESVLTIARCLVDYVTEILGENLTVDKEYDIEPEVIEECARDINDSGMGSTSKIFAEVIQQTLYKVYMRCHRQQIRERCRSGEKRETNVPELDKDVNEMPMRECVITLDYIWMKKAKLFNFTAYANSQGIQTKYQCTGGNFECHLTGSTQDFTKLVDHLHQICKEELCWKKCTLMITKKEAVHELDVADALDQHLLHKGLKCFVIQKQNELYVYGPDVNTNDKACSEVECLIIEKPYVVFGEQQKEELQQLMKHYDTNIVFVHENRNKGYVIGFRNDIHELIKAIDNIKANTSSQKLHEAKKKKEKHEVQNDEVYEFLRCTKYIEDICDNLEAEICFESNASTNCLVVEYNEDSTKQVLKAIRSIEDDIMSIQIECWHPKAQEFIMSKQGQDFLEGVGITQDVILKQHTERQGVTKDIFISEDVTVKPNRQSNSRIVWAKYGKKQLVLVTGNTESVQATLAINLKQYNQDKATFEKPTQGANGATAVVHVPKRNNGRQNEGQKFENLLTKILCKAAENDDDSISMSVEPVEQWPFPNYLHCIAMAATKWLFGRSKAPRAVILCADGKVHYEEAVERMERCFQSHYEALKIKQQSKLNIILTAGELNNCKVDVIVNTTARDLDLSHGRVSSTLLKVAGSGLQRECKAKYPNGISKREVAVTEGHKLNCKRVFHITLQRYMQTGERDMNSIQDIRYLVNSCLQIASDEGLKSIAFPAIGTGILHYPAKLVASAMFESVEIFRSEHVDTSLECVSFIIYPRDVKVMEIFQKNKQFLDIPQPTPEKSVKIKFEIMGRREHVQFATSTIQESFETAKTDPDEIVEMEIKDITRAKHVILLHLIHEDIKKIKESIKCWTYNEQENKLVLQGKCRNVTQAISKLRQQINQIRNFRVLSVKKYDKRSVEFAVVSLNESQQQVYYVFDQFGGLVYIVGRNEQLVAMEKQLLHLLDCENGDNLSSFPDNYRENGKQEKCSMKTNEDNKTQTVGSKPDSASQFGNSGDEETVKYRAHANETSQQLTVTNEKTQCMSLAKETDINKDKSSLSKCLPVSYNMKKTKSSQKAGRINPLISESDAQRPSSWSKSTTNMKSYQAGHIMVKVYEANIVTASVECIVNAANKNLEHDGGLAATIANTAGESLIKASNEIVIARGALPVTSVVRTTAGKLDYKCVLHAVGPCWYDYKPITKQSLEQCEDDLKQTVTNCFKAAEKHNMKSIALPTISSELFAVPQEICATQYARAVLQLADRDSIIDEIHFVDINPNMIGIVHRLFRIMIEQGKTPIVNESYLVASASGPASIAIVEGEADKSVGEHTVRDTLKELRIPNELINLGEVDTIEETEAYEADGDTLKCAWSPSHVTEDPELAEEVCVICMDKLTDAKKLQCEHKFCTECIDGYFRVKPVCPTCGHVCGIITGDQPDGTMEIGKLESSVAGYEGHKSLAVTYHFRGGIQYEDHPQPGAHYKGITHMGFLPGNKEGREICAMLKVAFMRRLIFTIGTSRTTGEEGVITWNDIHHKTDPRPHTQFGYPDNTYLQRVCEELQVKGVMREDIENRLMKELEQDSYRGTFSTDTKL